MEWNVETAVGGAATAGAANASPNSRSLSSLFKQRNLDARASRFLDRQRHPGGVDQRIERDRHCRAALHRVDEGVHLGLLPLVEAHRDLLLALVLEPSSDSKLCICAVRPPPNT